MDAIDELVAHSGNHPDLRDFHDFHRAHPEVLDFLVREIRARIAHGFPAFSYGSLWEYCRWKLQMEKGPGETFLMNDHLTPIYARVIAFLHPEFNGRAELRTAKVDSIFGFGFEPDIERPKDYGRRLQWVDGTSFEDGWRPSVPHVPSRFVAQKPDIHARVEV